MPVLAGPGETAHLEAQDHPDMVHGDLGQQALETEPGVGGAAALPEVVVDDEDPIGGPAEGAGMISQGILAGERLAILNDLLRAGLADVDDGQLGPMGIGDLDGLEMAVLLRVIASV